MKKEKGKEERENCVEHIQSDRELWSGVCILGTIQSYITMNIIHVGLCVIVILIHIPIHTRTW